MYKTTYQEEQWLHSCGNEYTDRNFLTLEEMEARDKRYYGCTRTEMNKEFIGDLDKSIRILEVGTNIGLQLQCLQKMGFKSLYGIELQQEAVEFAKVRTKNINIIQGSAFDIPFKDGFFDLIFTSDMLIHIASSDIVNVLKEIHRCTKNHIFGFEYFADNYTEINWRGRLNLLWKTDYVKLYLDNFSDLKLIKEKKFKYLENDNVDTMFLLKKMKIKAV